MGLTYEKLEQYCATNLTTNPNLVILPVRNDHWIRIGVQYIKNGIGFQEGFYFP